MSATGRGTQRHPDDFYRTPKSAIEVIKPYVRGIGVLDPSAGDGAIVEAFPGAFGIELDPVRAWASGSLCADALAVDWPAVSWVVMNPPFKLAAAFVEKAVRHAPNVAALLRLSWLASASRAPFLRQHTPGIVVLSSFAASYSCRPCGLQELRDLRDPPARCACGKTKKTTTDAADYAWFMWGEHAGKVVIP